MGNRTRRALGVLALILAVALPGAAMMGTAAVASPGPSVGEVVAGGACTQAQAAAHARGTHDGAPYECRSATGADGKPCWLWKRVIVAGEPTGRWSGGPATCKTCSPSASPSGSTSSSPSPSVSVSPSSSPSGSPASSPTPSGSTSTSPGPVVSTTPVSSSGPSLPKTGTAVTVLVAVGLLSVAFGAWFVRAGRRRRVA